MIVRLQFFFKLKQMQNMNENNVNKSHYIYTVNTILWQNNCFRFVVPVRNRWGWFSYALHNFVQFFSRASSYSSVSLAIWLRPFLSHSFSLLLFRNQLQIEITFPFLSDFLAHFYGSFPFRVLFNFGRKERHLKRWFIILSARERVFFLPFC